MKAAVASGEADALARLRTHENALDCRLAEARQQSSALLAEARRQADDLRRRGESDQAVEIERLRAESARELEAVLAATRTETARSIQALRGQAEGNRERVLAWLLSRVSGRDAP